MANILDCEIVVSEFELQSRYYIHIQTNNLGKGMNSRILQDMAWIVSLLFLYKYSFRII